MQALVVAGSQRGITTTTAGRFGCSLTSCVCVIQCWGCSQGHHLQQPVYVVSLLCFGLDIIAITAGFVLLRPLIQVLEHNPPTLRSTVHVVQAWPLPTACSWLAGHLAAVHLAERLANTTFGAGSAASCPSISGCARPLALRTHPDGCSWTRWVRGPLAACLVACRPCGGSLSWPVLGCSCLGRPLHVGPTTWAGPFRGVW